MNPISFPIDTQITPAVPVTPFSQAFTQEIQDDTSPFTAFFNAAINMLNDTNMHQVQADTMQLAFATGQLDDILALQMAQDRAFTSLNFTIQVTNRIIESYREIMRMQI